jgi:hypothetical protein
MAAPVYGKGFTSGLVLAAEAVAFGTLGATGIAVPFVSETLTRKPDYIPHDVKIGKGASAYPSVVGVTDVSGTLVTKVDYDNMARFFAQLTGDASSQYIPADEVTLSTSIVVNRNVERLQYTGGVIEEARLIGNVANNNGLIMLETDWVFQLCTPSSDAILSASLTASTYAKMSELTLMIGDISDALSGTTDKQIIRDFVLRYKNNFKLVQGSQSGYIRQPIRDIPREVTFEFTIENYVDSTTNTVLGAIKTALRAHTQLQANLAWDGPGSDAISINLPELFPADVDNLPISDDKILTFPVKLRAYKNIHNTTNMASSTEEVDFTLTT